MLEFWKNGKEIKYSGIYQNGRIGQMVVLDYVSYGENPDFSKYPLAKYSHPSVFTIVEKVEGTTDGYYVVRDEEGNLVRLHNEWSGASEASLYDFRHWNEWRTVREEEERNRRDRAIETLKDRVDLLKKILVEQGFRVVSEKQAKELGIS